MNILYTLLQYGKLTGSELYVYELSREMVKRGHTVAITPQAIYEGGLVERTEANGVQIDGAGIKWDVIHASQYAPTKASCTLGIPVVQTVHSEHSFLWEYEKPHIAPEVKAYIAIRREIEKRVIGSGVSADKVHLAYNPIDLSRFYPRMNKLDHKAILFAGTLDQIRLKPAMETIKIANEMGAEVWFMGDGEPYTGGGAGVRYLPSRFDIENVLAEATHTAGLLMGRTTLEGWAMGKPAFIFDENGKVEYKEPPDNLDFMDSVKVADSIEAIYRSVL